MDCDDCGGSAVYERLLRYQREPGLRADAAVALDWLADHVDQGQPRHFYRRLGDAEHGLSQRPDASMDALLLSLMRRGVLVERRGGRFALKSRIGLVAEQAALLTIQTDTERLGQEWIMSTLQGERQRGACVVGLVDALCRLMARRRLESRESTWLLSGRQR